MKKGILVLLFIITLLTIYYWSTQSEVSNKASENKINLPQPTDKTKSDTLEVTNCNNCKFTVFQGVPVSKDIPNGGSVAFGSLAVNKIKTINFAVQNPAPSTEDLKLTGHPNLVSIEGTDMGDFSIKSYPETPIPAGNISQFSISFNPKSTGLKNAVIKIKSNQPTIGTYIINISGTGN